VTWSDEDPSDAARYRVVVNDEEQYSIWPEGWDLPGGWQATGYSGGKSDCLSHIDEVWIDMRPRSLRQKDGGRV
jgi:MbtH protein